MENFNIDKDTANFSLDILASMGDPDYTAEIIADILKETPKDLQAMRAGIEKNEPQVVARITHKLKSSVVIIEAVSLVSLLTGIESVAKSANQGL